MVKKALRLISILNLSILLLIVVPFNNIYADTISASNVVGVNVELLGSTTLEHREDQGNNYYYKQYSYKAIIELDNSYVGVIGARVQGNYYEKAPVQGSQLLTQAFNYYRKIYVNGNSAEMTFVISTWYSSVQDPINYRSDGTSPSVSIEDSNVTKFEDIDSINQIIDLLSDIYQNSNDIEGLSTNQLTELQKIVSNTSLANDYLDIISQMRQYNIPFESFSFVMYLLSHRYEISEYSNVYYTNYPRFVIPSGSNLFSTNGSTTGTTKSFDLIFVTNKTIRNTTELNNMMTINNGELEYVNRITSFVIGSTGNYLIHIRAQNFTGNGMKNITVNSQELIVPICAFYTDNQYFSTEFALKFGLSNSLLDNIQLIANGTNASSAASSQSDQANSQLQQDSNTLFSQEDSFKQNMQQSMNNIDTTFSLNNFGSSFMTSAQWVRTQYETLTNNTPFASLITFSLLVGLALIVVGKVYK